MSLLSTCAPIRGYSTTHSTRNRDNNTYTRHHAFYFSHSKGQHILKNPGIIKDMIDKSGIKSTDIVLEIGPGTGNLTMQLLPKCKKVICVEVDARMVCELRKRVKSYASEYEQKLKIIHGDAIKTRFPFFNLCIANIPFQISSPLLFKLLAHRPHFRCAILMVQHEFAQRCVARVGDYLWCRLSINCQLLARMAYLKKIGKANFRPPPKVESALIRIEPRRPPPPINFMEWDGIIRICFERRHRLLNKIFHNKHVIKSLFANYVTFMKLKHVMNKKNLNGNGGRNRCQQLEMNSNGNGIDSDVELFLNDCKTSFNAMNEDIVIFDEGNILNLDEFKLVIIEILNESGMRQKRSRHLDVTDFLQLLKLFNDRNIHFK